MKMIWAIALGMAIGAATHCTLAAAEATTDFEAEKKQIAKEVADQAAEREKGVRGKYQIRFTGTAHLLLQPNEELSPDVVGHFVTSVGDPRPRRSYQIILAEQGKDLLPELKKFYGKIIIVRGKLRLIDANGMAKYLFLESIEEEAGPTPKAPDREMPGSL